MNEHEHESAWVVTYGTRQIIPGKPRVLNRRQRLARQARGYWYWLRYSVEDAWWLVYYRVKNAWGVLIGRERIL